MRGFLCFFQILLFTSNLSAQEGFLPTVVVLTAADIKTTSAIRKELQSFEEENEITPEMQKNYIPDDLGANWKLSREKELEFIRKRDYQGVFALLIAREITYDEVQHHRAPLIFPVRESCGADREMYKTLCRKYKVNWLVNIPRLELSASGSTKYLKAHVQLYNVNAGWLFIDKTFAVDDLRVPEACDKGSWMCLIDEAKTVIARTITDKIDRNGYYNRPRK